MCFRLGLLLHPHLDETSEPLVHGSSRLKFLQRLNHEMHDVGIHAVPQQFPHRLGELLVHVAREGQARIFGQDTHQHDRVVHVACLRPEILVHEFADVADALGCGGRGGLGSFDNARQESYFGTLAIHSRSANRNTIAEGVPVQLTSFGSLMQNNF